VEGVEGRGFMEADSACGCITDIHPSCEDGFVKTVARCVWGQWQRFLSVRGWVRELREDATLTKQRSALRNLSTGRATRQRFTC
jgi:hypothetical protein